MTEFTFRYRTDGGSKFQGSLKSKKTGMAVWREIVDYANEEIDAENERYGRAETLVAITLDRHPFET